MQSTRKCLHLLEPALLGFVLPINSHEDARGFVWICVGVTWHILGILTSMLRPCDSPEPIAPARPRTFCSSLRCDR